MGIMCIRLTNFYLWDSNFNMYFIEFIIKNLTQKKERKANNTNFPPANIEEENCEHVFMPIDSTNETLSCSKCGIIVKRNDLKYKNFFENKNFLT